MVSTILPFVGTLCLILLLRKYASGFGLVDAPSGRKTHTGEIPLIGGLAIGTTFILASLTLYSNEPIILPLIVCCLIILVTGVFDDIYELSARNKFVGQGIAAVLMASWAGLSVSNLGDIFGTGDVELGAWAVPFTVFCVIGLINAINMIDGLDGLAGGIAAIAAVWIGIISQIVFPVGYAALLFSLAAAVGGFLVFNLRHPLRKRASVFLGDAGSMFLGFALVWFIIHLTEGSSAAAIEGGAGNFYPISAVWILGLPIIDTLYLMLRRTIRSGSPFAADRRHIHHTLMYMGLSAATTLWVLLAVSALLGTIGFCGWYFSVPEYVLTIGFIGMFATYCAVMQYWKQMFAFFSSQHGHVLHKTAQ